MKAEERIIKAHSQTDHFRIHTLCMEAENVAIYVSVPVRNSSGTPWLHTTSLKTSDICLEVDCPVIGYVSFPL